MMKDNKIKKYEKDDLFPISDEESNINISIDFTVDECECGSKVPYNFKICPDCRVERKVNIELLDPIVKIRRDKFKDIVELIKVNDKELRECRKALREKNKTIVDVEEFREEFLKIIENLHRLSIKHIYKDMSVESNYIKKVEFNKKIHEIEEYFSEIYTIYKRLIVITPPYLWSNVYNRLCSIVRNLLNFNKNIIEAIIAENMESALSYRTIAQQKLDQATEDIEILDDIFSVKNLEDNFNLIEDGEINISLALMMMCGFKDNEKVDIQTQYYKMQTMGYMYFRELIDDEFDLEQYINIKCPILFKLCSYRFMSITCFSEKDFLEKTKIVVNTLKNAQEKNSNELKQFIDKFKDTYLYILQIIDTTIQSYIMNLSFCNNENLFIRNAMGWYKDLSEGVYKGITTLLVACGYIIDKKELDYETILTWNGFGDNFDYMIKKKKLRFDKLTEGIDKIIRHSEAHVDFRIDSNNRKILLNNKISREKIINEESYTYEEFLQIQVKLQETIFSIITAIDIFMINNYKEFKYFIEDVDKIIQLNNKANEWKSPFGLLGITNLESIELIEDSTNIVLIKGISVYKKNKEILEKCLSCVVPLIKTRDDIDLIRVELYDVNNNMIGNIEVIAKYIRNSFIVSEKLKKYEYLLSLKTTRYNLVDGSYEEEEDKYEFKFIMEILQWILELIELRNSATCNIDKLEKIKAELVYNEKTLKEYRKYKKNIILLEYVEEVVENYINVIDIQVNSIIANSREEFAKADRMHREVCVKIADIIGTRGNEEEIKKFLTQLYKKQYKIGRNDICPCGSGKKYKKCCMKYLFNE